MRSASLRFFNSIILITLTAAAIPNGTPAQKPLTIGRRHHAPIIIRERHGGMVTSSNWSGYAVTGSRGTVNDVKASWVVPMIQGSCPSTTQYSSFWVGIDGYSSNTVEQIGTDSDCVNGSPSYYAWFEFYPHLSYNINTVPVKPGDVISAEVSYSGGQFTVSLKNVTTGGYFNTSTKMNNADRSSAEWIAEAPSGGGILPLANFGSVSFGSDITGVSSTCDATLTTGSGPIGSFPAANVFDITMTNSSGAPEATPGQLSKDGTTFMVSRN